MVKTSTRRQCAAAGWWSGRAKGAGIVGATVQSELSSGSFARRLGDLLSATRRSRGCSCRTLARLSAGRFTLSGLHRLERGDVDLDEETVEVVSELYGADLDSILANRYAVVVEDGVMSVGGMSTPFLPAEPMVMLTTYLKLLRSLRRQQRASWIELRRDDVDRLAMYLEVAPETVIDHLGELMGATRAQRGSMATLFGTGAVVIGIVASLAVAPISAGAPAHPPATTLTERVPVVAEIHVQPSAPREPTEVAQSVGRPTHLRLAPPMTRTTTATTRTRAGTGTTAIVVPDHDPVPAPVPDAEVDVATNEHGDLVASDLGTGDQSTNISRP